MKFFEKESYDIFLIIVFFDILDIANALSRKVLVLAFTELQRMLESSV